MNRKVQLFSYQVVEGGADRALGRGVSAQNPIQVRFSRLQRKWIGTLEHWLELPQRGNDARDRLAIIAIRGRFAVTLNPVVIDESHNHVAMMRVAAPRDHERVDWIELDCLVRKPHYSKSGSAFEQRAKLH